MKIAFHKFHGAGNDFILIDNRRNQYFSPNQVNYLCNRRLGIGADGLIFLTLATDCRADFRMIYYNSDGEEASLCGNGSRCVIAFAHYLGIITESCCFQAFDGLHEGKILSHQSDKWDIRIQMLDTSLITHYEDGYHIDTGSPHLIQYQNDIHNFDVYSQGKRLRYDSRFPFGVNVDFVAKTKEGIFVRTYERGVEEETLSCGTGVTAAALVNSIEQQIPDGIIQTNVTSLGGSFIISFKKKGTLFSHITLTGPVQRIFDGVISLD